MLLVKLNGVDITDKVDYNTVKITEQMNNRSNTCSFTVSNYMVPEGAIIEIWEGSVLTADVASGVSTIPVDDTFEYFQKYRVGDVLRIPAGSTGAIKRTILSIDHTAKTITFTTTLGTAYIKGTKVGRLIFAGVTMKNPDQEIGCSGVFVFNVTATDFTKLFDAKNVVDTFEDQYPREVIGRVTHKFTATSSFLEVSDAETTTGWTAIGVAVTPGTSTTDRAYKNASVTGGASGAGTMTYRFTPAAVVNISSFTHIRPWLKIGAGQLSKLTAPKFRAVTSVGNYLEWSDMYQCEDCWSYDSFEITDGVATGTPNLASIAYFEYQWTTSSSITLGDIKFDQLSLTTGSFTLKNVMQGNTKYGDIRAQYKKPTVLLEELSKLLKLYWYIDYERDIHFFEQESYTCPMEILDASEVYGDLSITADISQLKNRQVVRGGEAIDASTYTQDEVTDGKLESWRLDYKPKGLKIYVDTTGTGASYVEKTVGVENLDSAASFDYLYNFNEKIVKRASAPLLASGTLFRRVYYPYKPIRVQVEDTASIIAMKALLGGDGIYDGALITDLSIRSFQDARDRAKAEIAPYKNPVITATWNSDQDGWRAGQIVHIQDTNRAIDSYFVIQKVNRNQKTTGRWSYQVQAGSTMFGLIEFFQLLLRRSENLLIDVSEIVDIVKTVDEVISIGETYNVVKKERPFFAPPGDLLLDLPFTGNALDRSGNGYNGTVTGATLTTDKGGAANSAYSFNGSSNYISLGDVLDAGTGNFSYSGWFQTSSVGALTGVFGKSRAAAGSRYAFLFESGIMYSLLSIGTTQKNVTLSQTGYIDGNWHFFAVTVNRFGMHTLYMDTVKKGEIDISSLSGTDIQSTDLCGIGAYLNSAGTAFTQGFFNGKIDNIRMYPRELSEMEVKLMYQDHDSYYNRQYASNTHRVGNLKSGSLGLTVSGASLTATDYFGNGNAAYSFDGNDLLTKTGLFTGMGQEFTLSAMIYPTNVTPATPFKIITSTTNQMGISINATTKLLDFHVYDTGYRILSVFTPVINTWYHVGMTYKNNVLTAYVNGVSQGTLAVTGPIVAGTDAHIGNRASLVEGFIGKIDEWGFEFTARDAAGMLELYKRCTIATDAYADYCEAT